MSLVSFDQCFASYNVSESGGGTVTFCLNFKDVMSRRSHMLNIESFDESAKFEFLLSNRLQAVEPLRDITRVDLSPFEPPKAKIDCIKFSWPFDAKEEVIQRMQQLISSRLKLPQDPIGESFIAIQDPTLDDLRFIFNEFPDAQVLHIEVAVDFRLPEGSNDLYLLRKLKEQLRHCMAPHEHPDFKKPLREFFDLKEKRWRPDFASQTCPYTTVSNVARTGMIVKTYIKTRDQKRIVNNPFVRLELTLRGVSTDLARLETLKDLPGFVDRMRKYCMQAFVVGQGFKQNDPIGNKWRDKGAVWGAKPSKGLFVKPDVGVHKAIGDAINELRRSLMRAFRVGS